ncbi:MAG TPA: low molecular weight phosphatase family protein [Alphaproteobacteria bacterium]|nr:low molecular weight phosphatase family protein [Alphaproteobacteria bacterium]
MKGAPHPATAGTAPERMPSAVLFSCSFNSVRSPMAEALMKYLYGHMVYVDSVGVRKQEIDPFVVEVLDEIGISVEKHKAKTFDDLEDTSFDLVVTLTPEAQHRALEMTRTMSIEVEYWPTPDPTAVSGSREQMLEAYRQVRDRLMAKIKERFGPLAPAKV